MPRAYCSTCGFPKVTCVCHAVQQIDCRTRIDILQHPNEARAAKNTARLCQLCLPHLALWPGETPDDFDDFRMSLAPTDHALFLYPSVNAIPLSEWRPQTQQTSDQPLRLVLIDATWRKAYRLMQLNPWLTQLQPVSLEGYQACYGIRKAPRAGQLSTLEAIAHALQQLEPEVSVAPLFQVLQARKAGFDH